MEHIKTGEDIAVAVAGTAVQGSNVPACREIVFVARSTNTGSVYIGGSDVTNNGGTKRGIELVPGGMIKIGALNLNEFWVNADNANDKVGCLVR